MTTNSSDETRPLSADRRLARQLAESALADGDPIGWFERLYATAGDDPTVVPWADLTPNPNLTTWLDGKQFEAAGRPALVVGCGLGDDAEELARRGFEVTAFDVSPTAVEWCRRRFPNSPVDYRVADLFKPPAEWHAAFDFIVEAYTLQVLPAEKHALAAQRISGCVAPSGTLLLITRGRDENDDPGGMPWPLTRRSLDCFRSFGLQEVAFEDYFDDEQPPVRRFRVEYRRQLDEPFHNYFESHQSAARYARGRPHFHDVVINRMCNDLSLEEPVQIAVDVGCGTGMSSVSLTKLSRRVIATDVAGEMLAHALPHPAVCYLQAPAERLPLAEACCPLVSVSSAVHWFDRERFLSEAARVLRRDGWMVTYENYFLAEMEDNEAFHEWFQDRYKTKYPNPPRGSAEFTNNEADAHGFELREKQDYRNTVRFTPGELVDYLITQSNITDAEQCGDESIDEIKHWLRSEVTGFFSGGDAAFGFGGSIWYLRRR